MNTLKFAKSLMIKFILGTGIVGLSATTGFSQTLASSESNSQSLGNQSVVIDVIQAQPPKKITLPPEPINDFTKIPEPSSVVGLLSLSVIAATILQKRRKKPTIKK